jgi:hypothetical protein
MKKLVMMFCLLAALAINSMAQTPWRIVNMEDVTRHGGNCEYDDETLTATFKGKWDRWFDLPGVKGDLTEHTQLNMTFLKSTCMLRIVLRYRNEAGEMKQVDAATLYGTMNKTIDSKKTSKIDLTNKGKIGEDVLKNVEAIRISMAKPVDGNEEPWMVQFGEVVMP